MHKAVKRGLKINECCLAQSNYVEKRRYFTKRPKNWHLQVIVFYLFKCLLLGSLRRKCSWKYRSYCANVRCIWCYSRHYVFVEKSFHYSPNEMREGMLAAAAVGFLVKHNASISGAEMGCMGEIGSASAMAAAMLTYCATKSIHAMESAAEIAIEHHLG
jgi:L-serine dehydratase